MRMVALAVAVIGLTGCDKGPSHTGYVGVWEGTSIWGLSRIQFKQQGEDYVFHWERQAPTTHIVCDGTGTCEEYGRKDAKVDGENELVMTWYFRPQVEAATGEILMDVEGWPPGAAAPEITYRDRLQVQPDGLELWAFTVRRFGEDLEQPAGPHKYTKVSNSPRF